MSVEADSNKSKAISGYLQQGYKVQSMSDNSVTLLREKKVGWFWNLVLTFATYGLWLIVWIVRLMNKRKVLVLNFDEHGIVINQNQDLRGFNGVDVGELAGRLATAVKSTFDQVKKHPKVASGAGLAVIALIVVSNITYNSSPAAKAKSVTYESSISIVQTPIDAQTCATLSSLANDSEGILVANKYGPTAAKNLSKMDAWAAQSYASKNSWVGDATTYVGSYKNALNQVLVTLLESRISSAPGPEYNLAYDANADSWKTKFVAYGLANCNLDTVVATNLKTIQSFEDSRTALNELALSAPWYPKGFNEYADDANVAWKWSNGGSCEYFSDACWHVQVITEVGCPTSLYVEITILDRRGNAIGYTNAVSGRVRAGKSAKLQLDSYDAGASSAELSRINCY